MQWSLFDKVSYYFCEFGYLRERVRFRMSKIKMTTPLVEMDGDEMTRILWLVVIKVFMTTYKRVLFFLNRETQYNRNIDAEPNFVS